MKSYCVYYHCVWILLLCLILWDSLMLLCVFIKITYSILLYERLEFIDLFSHWWIFGLFSIFGNNEKSKLVLEKAEEPEIKLSISAGSWKKQKSSRKTSISALLTMPKPLTVWITINCGKFFKRWEYQTTWPASWEICMQVGKQQWELDMEQQTGSK